MKYGLVKCWPVGFGSANETLAECNAGSLAEAATLFATIHKLPLNNRGYAKIDEITYCVAEVYPKA